MIVSRIFTHSSVYAFLSFYTLSSRRQQSSGDVSQLIRVKDTWRRIGNIRNEPPIKRRQKRTQTGHERKTISCSASSSMVKTIYLSARGWHGTHITPFIHRYSWRLEGNRRRMPEPTYSWIFISHPWARMRE